MIENIGNRTAVIRKASTSATVRNRDEDNKLFSNFNLHYIIKLEGILILKYVLQFCKRREFKFQFIF